MQPEQADKKEILLEARGISKCFGARKVVDDVSLSLAAQKVLTLIGPNGSGKTTLIRLLLGLEKPDSGEVFRRKGLRVGYMPQKLSIDPILPVTAGWFLQLHSHRHSPSEDKLHAVCDEVDIGHALNTDLRDLSGGELQRLQLARALLCQPELLVLDEPVQGVDVGGQARLYELISRITREHKLAVLMVSHDLHLVMSATDEVICLNHHVCCAGTPHAVQNDPTFANLFSPREAETLAVYTHEHDHDHEHDCEHGDHSGQGGTAA